METMSKPLTDEEIANLRKLYGALPDGDDFGRSWAFFVAARNAMPSLLDELERLRGIVGATDWVAEESGPKDSYVWVRQRRPR